MSTIEYNLLAIIAAVAVNMIMGFLWYAKPVFGEMWQKLVGLTDKDIKQSDTTSPMVIMLLLAVLQVIVLVHFVAFVANYYPSMTQIMVGLYTGAWAWCGFVLPVMGGAYIFAQRRKKLLAIDATFSLVVLLINGVLLSVWK